MWSDTMPLYRKSSKLTKVPTIFNEETVGWNMYACKSDGICMLAKNACKSITSACLMD